MTAFYIDVSHHDRDRRGGPLDWSAIARYTAPVMVARATYGDPSGWNRASRYHAEFHSGARAAGFTVRGSYHNLVKGDAASIARQVDWLRREADAVGSVWAMLDVERYPELVTADMWPRWDDVQQFCARWHAVDDRVLTAYIPGWLYSGYYAGKDVAALGVPIVESDYGSNPGGLPAAGYAVRGGDSGRGWSQTGNVTPTVWQFSSQCDMPGATGQTDINAFRGAEAQLMALLSGGTTQDTGDNMTMADLAAEDVLTNGYPDAAVNPKITFHTFVKNVATHTYDTWLTAKRTEATIGTMAAKVDAMAASGDNDVLARIDQRHAEAMQRLVDMETREQAREAEMVAAFRDALPAGSDPVTREELEDALRSVYGKAFGQTTTTTDGQA